MNNNYIKDIIQNKCCYDKENTPIIPGDIICYAFDKSIYTTTVIKIDSIKNEILFKSNNFFKKFLKSFEYMKFNASNVLNVSKKYNIFPSENIKIIKKELITKLLIERKLKYIIGYGLNNNSEKIIFQICIKRDSNINSILKEKCKHLNNIHILYDNNFIKYPINNAKLFSYYNPIILSENEFFIPNKLTCPVKISNDIDYYKLHIFDSNKINEYIMNFTNQNNIYKQLFIDTFFLNA